LETKLLPPDLGGMVSETASLTAGIQVDNATGVSSGKYGTQQSGYPDVSLIGCVGFSREQFVPTAADAG
jgi:hypothetical protein